MNVVDRRAESSRRVPPSVVVRCADPAVLREIRAGMEEEGVPLRVEEPAAATAIALAHGAARASPLGVGIGADATEVCVHHAKRPADAPVLTATPQLARLCGHNAARLVVGLPLKPLAEEEAWPHN